MSLFDHRAPTLLIETESCNTPRNTPICAAYTGIPMADTRTDSTYWRTGREETSLSFWRQSGKKTGPLDSILRRDELCRARQDGGGGTTVAELSHHVTTVSIWSQYCFIIKTARQYSLPVCLLVTGIFQMV